MIVEDFRGKTTNSRKTTQALAAVAQVVRAFSSDDQLICLDSIDCSGHGRCSVIDQTVVCECENEWAGKACDKNRAKLSAAKDNVRRVSLEVLKQPATSETVVDALSTFQVLTKDSDLAPTELLDPMSDYVTEALLIAPVDEESLLSIIDLTSRLSSFEEVTSNTENLAALQKATDDSANLLIETAQANEEKEYDLDSIQLKVSSPDALFEVDSSLESDFSSSSEADDDGRDERYSPLRRLLNANSEAVSEKKQQLLLEKKLQTDGNETAKRDPNLKMILQSKLARALRGMLVKMKAEKDFALPTASFTIPRLTLQVTKRVRFALSNDNGQRSKRAANRKNLVTSTVSFNVKDGGEDKTIENLEVPLNIVLKKMTPLDPVEGVQEPYVCSYYDDASRRFRSDGCSFVGENLTHIFCRCTHATEFGALTNANINSQFANIFTASSIDRLIELTADAAAGDGSSNQFSITIRQNILSKKESITKEIEDSRTYNYWGLLPPIILIVLIVAIVEAAKHSHFTKSLYLINYDSILAGEEITLTARQQAWMFMSLKAFLTGNSQTFISDPKLRTFTLSTEIINTMGHVLLWLLLKQYTVSPFTASRDTFGSYLQIAFLAYVTSMASFYLVFGGLGLYRIKTVSRHLSKLRSNQIGLGKLILRLDLVHKSLCVITIAVWLCTILGLTVYSGKSSIKQWLRYCAVLWVISYIFIDLLLAGIYRFKKWEKMLYLLAIRGLSALCMSKASVHQC